METLSASLLGDFGPSSAKKKFYFESVGRMMTTEKAAQANKVNSASLGITSLNQRYRKIHNKISVLLFSWLALFASFSSQDVVRVSTSVLIKICLVGS